MNLVEVYISTFAESHQVLLNQVRLTIQNAVPDAIEGISYGMPAYKLNGKPLAYFAGFKNHIGLYATPNAHKQFQNQLLKYKQGKGSVQFPIDQPMPLRLISEIVSFKANEIRKLSK